MLTMTSKYGVFFVKLIQLEKKNAHHHFLFSQMFSNSGNNYLVNFKNVAGVDFFIRKKKHDFELKEIHTG